MRPIVVALLAAFPVTSLAAQTAGVEGVVVNKVTGQPLSDVHLRVLTGDVATLTVERVYGAMTDRAGHFSISNMKPGLYLIVPERTGFVFVRPPGPIPATVLALRAGQQITDQKVEMTPCGFVSGRVVDDAGDPVPGAYIDLHAVPPDIDFVNPFAIPQPNFSDDRGEFRIAVFPGKYNLQAMPRNAVMMMGTGPAGSPVGPYVPTFYPSANRAADAAPIDVKPGRDAGPLEIRLTHAAPSVPGARPTSIATISGLVTGIPDGGRAAIMVRVSQRSGPVYTLRGYTTDPDGKFMIRGLPPGPLQLFAQFPLGKAKLQSQVVDVPLTDVDTANLQLHLAPGEDLAGSLEIAGEEPASAPSRPIAVQLELVDRGGPGVPDLSPAAVGKDGAFHVAAILPGRYRVRVEPMPDGAFVRSMTLDGAAVEDAGLDFAHGGSASRLKIVLSRSAGELSGRVLDHNGAPLASPLAAVLLWKDAAQVKPDFNMVADSRYVLKGLRPGKYRLLAVDAYDFTNLAGAGDQDEFAKALRTAAEEIEVAESARIVKDLKVAAREDIHVQAK
ncbi:MAG TPA: carboxypeptidase-like regulatory domain-containing protein [Verrucomicrobiae bacterium]|nr:carboxypeptidase-like regulatory domain-containing protein [Verrucomicrobiae bacterium]